MVIDSSAIIAIVLNEPEADRFQSALKSDRKRLVSAASVLESSIVLEHRFGEEGDRLLDHLIAGLAIEIVSVNLEQLAAARVAHHRFGRGRHKARLNFGDCFSYALAKVSGEPLLYKGNDFALTDLAAISPPP
jgi:ribonuclease VapC